MMAKCRPFYLPREFSAVIIITVYILSQETKNNNLAINKLYEAIIKQETMHLVAAFLVAGEFNSRVAKTRNAQLPSTRLLMPLEAIKS
jgi:hypothetical protein